MARNSSLIYSDPFSLRAILFVGSQVGLRRGVIAALGVGDLRPIVRRFNCCGFAEFRPGWAAAAELAKSAAAE